MRPASPRYRYALLSRRPRERPPVRQAVGAGLSPHTPRSTQGPRSPAKLFPSRTEHVCHPTSLSPQTLPAYRQRFSHAPHAATVGYTRTVCYTPSLCCTPVYTHASLTLQEAADEG